MATEREIDATVRFVQELMRTPWLSSVRGGLPKVPTVETLPTASEVYGYRVVTVRGTPDVTYQCLRDNTGAWGWETVATG